MSSKDLPAPILKYNERIINGVIKIEITNLMDILHSEVDYASFNIKYRLNHAKNNDSNAWKSKEFTIDFIMEDKIFYLKIPLFFFPYTLEYNLRAHVMILNDNENGFSSEQSSPQSINYQTDIPSIFFDSNFKINDCIVYDNNTDGTVESGIVVEICEAVQIKIKLDSSNDILTVDLKTIAREWFDTRFIVDINEQCNILMETVLNIDNNNKKSVFQSIYEHTTVIMFDIFGHTDHMVDKELVHQSHFIAICVHQFLFAADFSYRMECLLGNTILYADAPWRDAIQGKVDTCDICNIEIGCFEYLYACHCEVSSVSGDDHVFCIACIYSVMVQYKQLKPFLGQLLKHMINDNCIEQIVAFCVGKFVELGGSNCKSWRACSKRKLTVNDKDLQCKRRKLC